MSRVPEYWEDAKMHIRKVDPILARVIDAHEEPPLRSKLNVFETLVHSIVGQQISAKAADAVWGRFVSLVGDVTPKNIAAHSPETLRSVGLSGRKVEYIYGLATESRWICDHPWMDSTSMDVKTSLLALRGVGPWTVEMVLIFSLLKPDVLPLGDIGVIRSVEQLYADGARLTKEEVAKIAEPWSPYRTVGTWYLWRHLDAEPVEY